MSDATVQVRVRSLVFVAGAMLLGAVMAAVVMSALRVDAAPGDVDTTTVPITACRLVDTRPARQVGPRDTPLGAEQTYTVNVQDASSECAGDVPVEASGLVLNVTAAQTSQQTFLTVWDEGPWPGTSSMNPAPGPPVPNAVTTKLSGSDTFEMYNNAGSTHLIVDIVAYLTPTSLTDLDDRMSALETAGVSQDVLDRIEALETTNAELVSKVSALETKTASMSVETHDGQPTVRFSGVNVQVVSGSGGTDDAINGRGNLIVGYNEGDDDQERTGSHNLVVGPYHSYSNFGGFVAGYLNTVSGPFSSVAGGSVNEAAGRRAAVLGGQFNTATGNDSTIAGGDSNNTTASAEYASITGGRDNEAIGAWSSITGGRNNRTVGDFGSITGGRDNLATGPYSSITGGQENDADGDYSTVTGGYANRAGDPEILSAGGWSTVTGGRSNQTWGDYSVVLGGSSNDAFGDRDTIIGGDDLDCDHADDIGFCGEGTVTNTDP